MPEGLHPLVILGARLALAFVALPLARGLAAVTLGRTRRDAFEQAYPFRFALLLAVPLGVFGLTLGFDALDPGLVGARIATQLVARLATAAVFATLTLLPLGEGLESGSRVREQDRAMSIMLFATGGVLAMGLFVARLSSTLGSSPFDAVTLANASWRSMLVPTDPIAHLALAYRATSSNLDRARRELATARSLGAPNARALEVESEIRARVGDCRGAETAFRASLEANVPEDTTESGSFSLRAFHLPPSLVSRCHYGAAEDVSVP